jgi:hypothetical protein
MTPAQIRSHIDHIAGWVYWIAALIVLVLFVAAVVRQIGFAIPMTSRLDGINLLYLAGTAWLLKR